MANFTKKAIKEYERNIKAKDDIINNNKELNLDKNEILGKLEWKYDCVIYSQNHKEFDNINYEKSIVKNKKKKMED